MGEEERGGRVNFPAGRELGGGGADVDAGVGVAAAYQTTRGSEGHDTVNDMWTGREL